MLFARSPSIYPMDTDKISLVSSLLTIKVLVGLWTYVAMQCYNNHTYLKMNFIVFYHLLSKQDAEERVLALRLGKQSTADYALPFLTLVVESEWTKML